MYRTERWPEEDPDPPPPPPRSRSSFRTSSASLSRHSSLKKEKEGKTKSPLNSAPATATSTPKKTVEPQNLEFMVTGKQIVKSYITFRYLLPEFADVFRKRSPEDMEAINNIIRTQGLHLTPRETQNVIKCAHLLGSVLTRAMDRRVSSDDPELTSKKKTMILPLKETMHPPRS
ncbi:hypothetical protein PYW07_011934 [Mythimna separata]|uniref:Uncharacterized protein n=1 Tax=Mythimna separata TaxID=271217 RepID=A0AAD7Y713_MYTSE|nr:hypothetical protein PYW07_011934 [Mythimna separata]